MRVCVNRNYGAGKSCVEEYRDEDHAMNSALDEPQNQRPPANWSQL
jgi:hypothetical protein